jgi:hypothetical protein
LDTGALGGTSARCADQSALLLEATGDLRGRADHEAPFGGRASLTMNDLARSRYFIRLKGLGDSCYYAGPPVLDMRNTVPDKVMLPVKGRGALEGRLILRSGGAHADYLVLATPSAAEPGEPAYIGMAPAPDGRFSATRLYPGEYRISVISASAWAAPQWQDQARDVIAVQVTPGHATTVDLPYEERVPTQIPALPQH